jgi:HPt (histidine-containing phosphotransfer) domain-containing protein
MDRFALKPVARDAIIRTIEELHASSVFVGLYPPELAGRPAFLASVDNDLDLARKLVEIFLDQSGSLLEEIRDAVEADDVPGLRRSAQALTTAISAFPAGAARDAAARMETIALDGELAAARQAFPALEQEVQRLRNLLPGMI